LTVAGALFALGARRPGEYLLLHGIVGGHQILVMASLGVLRSCGLRLFRQVAIDSTPAKDIDFSTWPFDNRPPTTSTDVPGGERSLNVLNTPT
jgi:hypothetical protein